MPCPALPCRTALPAHCRTTALPDPLPAPGVKPTLPCPAQTTLPGCEFLPAREVSEKGTRIWGCLFSFFLFRGGRLGGSRGVPVR